MDGLTRSVVFGRARLARIYLLHVRRIFYDSNEKPRGAGVHHITYARPRARTHIVRREMANYHKPDLRVIQQLQDLSNKLRIHTINATQASKSG